MSYTEKERSAVYEIGYLIATSVPEEKVAGETEAIKKIVTDAGAVIIADEAPHLEQLAYEMRKKTVSGSYEKYDRAYFGWVKFEVGTDKIESIKKAFETYPSILRTLVMTTVKENTYLGKRAAHALAAELSVKSEASPAKADEKDVAPATVEDMDKSIDAMVKEA